jgi:hypothetical protein
MEELRNSILYGTLAIDVPEKLTLAQQLELVRALVVNPAAHSRLKMPPDSHPWVQMLYSKLGGATGGGGGACKGRAAGAGGGAGGASTTGGAGSGATVG